MQLAETIEINEVAVLHTVLLSVSQHLSEESTRNKAIQACLPSCNSVQYFLQISLKSSRFFFLEKYQETRVCGNRIHKIQTSTGLYKSISVCLMTKKSFRSF